MLTHQRGFYMPKPLVSQARYRHCYNLRLRIDIQPCRTGLHGRSRLTECESGTCQQSKSSCNVGHWRLCPCPRPKLGSQRLGVLLSPRLAIGSTCFHSRSRGRVCIRSYSRHTPESFDFADIGASKGVREAEVQCRKMWDTSPMPCHGGNVLHRPQSSTDGRWLQQRLIY